METGWSVEHGLVILSEKIQDYARTHTEIVREKDNIIRQLRSENAELKRQLDAARKPALSPFLEFDFDIARLLKLSDDSFPNEASMSYAVSDPAAATDRLDLGQGHGEDKLANQASVSCESTPESAGSLQDLTGSESRSVVEDNGDLEVEYQRVKTRHTSVKRRPSFDDSCAPFCSTVSLNKQMLPSLEGPMQRARSTHRPKLVPAWESSQILSPDIQEKMEEIRFKELCEKYGGVARSQRAAWTIQRAYRDYRLRQFIKKLISKPRRSTSTKLPALLEDEEKGGLGSNTPHSVLNNSIVGRAFEKPSLELSTISSGSSLSHSLSTLSMSDIALIATSTSGSTASPSHASEDSQFFFAETSSVSSNSSRASGSPVQVSGYLETGVNARRPPSPADSPTSVPRAMLQRRSTAPRLTAGGGVQRTRPLRIGIYHFNRNPAKGIQYLIKKGILKGNSQAVAVFLRGQKGLSRLRIGEYFGNIRDKFCLAVLEDFINTFDFRRMSFVHALRKFMATFRIPGEAQKIEKILEMFAGRYSMCNPQGPVSNPDTALVLAFSVMMLNTDLHNHSVKRHMTKEEFVKNNRGLDNGQDLPREFLENIYDDIFQREFATASDHVRQVQDLEKTISGSNSRLAQPHRMLIHVAPMFEVPDAERKQPSMAHPRVLFLFNDLLMVVKYSSRKGSSYTFKNSFPLLGMKSCEFSNQYYKNAFQLKTSIDDRVMATFNADKMETRNSLLCDLNEALAEIIEMEEERMQGMERMTQVKTRSVPTLSPEMSRRNSHDHFSVDVGEPDAVSVPSPLTSQGSVGHNRRRSRTAPLAVSRTKSATPPLSDMESPLPAPLPIQSTGTGNRLLGSLRRGSRRKKASMPTFPTVNNSNST